MTSSAHEQRGRRLAIIVRQALLMICASIEREFGLQNKAQNMVRVEIVYPDEPAKQNGVVDKERAVL